jgi:hypothetical protein
MRSPISPAKALVFVQQNAGPAGAEHHVHLSGWGGDRIQVHLRLAECFVDLRLPRIGFDIGGIAGAAAGTVAAGFHAVAIGADDRDVDAHERANVAATFAVCADDLHRLPFSGNRCRELRDAVIQRPCVIVHVFQQFDLGREIELAERVGVGI